MTIISSYNPATGARVFETQAAGPSEVSHVLKLALAAYPDWKRQSFQMRADLILSYKKVLEAKKESLATAISEEMGKPLWESLIEVESMIAKADISIKAYTTRCMEEIGDHRATRFHPHGVVAVLDHTTFLGTFQMDI